LSAEDMATKWTIVVAANLKAQTHAHGIDGAGDRVVGLVVICLPEPGLVGDMNLAVRVQVLTSGVKEQGGVESSTILVADNRPAEQADADLGGQLRLHAVPWSMRRFAVIIRRVSASREPRQHSQFWDHGKRRATGFGFEQSAAEPLATGMVMEHISDQGDSERVGHRCSVLACFHCDGL
jgi:hypothetical protein